MTREFGIEFIELVGAPGGDRRRQVPQGETEPRLALAERFIVGFLRRAFAAHKDADIATVTSRKLHLRDPHPKLISDMAEGRIAIGAGMLVIKSIELMLVDNRPEIMIFDYYCRLGTYQYPEIAIRLRKSSIWAKTLVKQMTSGWPYRFAKSVATCLAEKIVDDGMTAGDRIAGRVGRLDTERKRRLLAKDRQQTAVIAADIEHFAAGDRSERCPHAPTQLAHAVQHVGGLPRAVVVGRREQLAFGI